MLELKSKLDWNASAEQWECDKGDGTMTVVSGDEFAEAEKDYFEDYGIKQKQASKEQLQKAFDEVRGTYLWDDAAYQIRTHILIQETAKPIIAETIVKELDPARQENGHWYTDGQDVYYSEGERHPWDDDTSKIRVDRLIDDDDRAWCSPAAEDEEGSVSWNIAVGNALVTISKLKYVPLAGNDQLK